MPLSSAQPLIHRAELKRRKLKRWLWLACLLVGGLLAAIVFSVLGSSKHAYETRARDTADGIAAIAQLNIAGELNLVDTVLLAAIDELHRMRAEGRPSDAAINQLLYTRFAQLGRGTEAVRLADVEGHVRWGSSLPAGVPAQIFDRAYFQEARDQRASKPIFIGPVRSRVSGNWVIGIARPVMLQGKFDGVLYVSIAVDHFRSVFARYDLGEKDAITIRMHDMRLVARHSPGSTMKFEVGNTNVSAELRAAVASNPASGAFVSRVAIDGIDRTTAYRQVDGWPLAVFAGLANDRFFEPWVAEAQWVSALAILAWILVTLAIYAIYRASVREAKAAQALVAQTERVRALLRTAGDGIHIVDQSGHLVEMSDSFGEMLGASRERLMGRHISSWDANQDEARITSWLERIKDGDKQRVDVQHRREDGNVIDVELQLRVADIEGQLFVFGSGRDVTEKKKLLASLEESAARVRDLYENAPCAYYSLDSEGRFVHANARLIEWLGCSRGEVIGARLTDFLDAASRDVFARDFPQLKELGQLDGIELRLTPPAAQTRHVRVSVTALTGHDKQFIMTRSVMLDVSAQRLAQERIGQLLREQTAMLDSELVGMLKLEGRQIIWKNRALEQMFGYGSDELDGQPVRLLYLDEKSYLKVGDQGYPLLLQGAYYRTQIQMRHKDGAAIWVDLSGIRLSDETSFWMAIDITLMKQANDKLAHVAFHDALTQLPNRLLLGDRLNRSLAACRRDGSKLALCYLDLDGFKAVNDELGHDAGDALLVEIARRLVANIRPTDTAARLGGDEFVLVLSSLDGADWRHVLDRVVEAICQPFDLGIERHVRVGTTVGVALAPDDGDDSAALLERADRALLRAKREGKGHVRLASDTSAI